MKNLNNLPTDLLLDIITRLPIDSILDCKLVCRSLRDLVSHHPSFCQLHLSRLNSSTDSGKTPSFLVKSRHQQLHYFEYNDETLAHTIKRFNLTLPFTSEYIVIGSFNGLICLYKSDHTSLICNPVTKEYVVLPKFKRGCGESGDVYVYCSSGFGYLPLTNQYKVVVLYKLRRQPSFVEAAVYALGSGQGWRNVGRSGFPFRLCYNETGVYANGALHWKENDEKGRILVFDLTVEMFRQCLSPPPVPPKLEGMRLNYFIGQLGGVLYCSIYYFVSDIHSDIWLLKEKKDQMEHEPLAWSKLLFCPGKEPLAFTESGGVLCYNYSSLNIYDAADSTMKKLLDFRPFCQIYPHKNTLVYLQELGEEDIKVMESAKIEETEIHDLSTKQLTT